MNAQCDNCKTDIEIKLQKRRLPDAVDLHFFTCQNCGREYPTHYTDPDIRLMQLKVKGMWEKLHKTKDLKKRDAIHEEIKKRQQQIGQQMDVLKARMQANG